ncbi:non-proteolytic archaemetzincin-like protein [Stigmatella erecta]|uniref:Archaemetzincin n=1 Tax=Stigmatella erecta TaxID=83460 RepID=A0A1I0KXK9_9BACT|nr:non-proteolytic archaemetzincin-like protein [Stigmatella erecta]SEU30835.1 archaemetzincin [Stigmatella erecta]
MTRKVLLLVTVGQPATSLLKDFEEPLSTHLGVQAVAGKTPLSRPDYAFNKSRSQYHCNAILRRLVTLQEPAHAMVLGITDVDLFVPDTAFVFGEADRESRSAVVSEARLRTGAGPELVRRRVQVEALHQVGHLLGLSFCEDTRCLMSLAQTPQEVDRKQLSLCNPCRNELNKLQR